MRCGADSAPPRPCFSFGLRYRLCWRLRFNKPGEFLARRTRRGARRLALVSSAPSSARTSMRSCQYDLYRHVIRGSFLAARFLVDGNLDQPIRRSRRQQEMIDADAFVALPSARLVIPKCVKRGGVRRCAQGVDQAEVEKGAKARPCVGQKKRVALPGGRIGGVEGRWNYIVVSGENERLLQRQNISYVRDEAIHERELIGVFLRLRRVG